MQQLHWLYMSAKSLVQNRSSWRHFSHCFQIQNNAKSQSLSTAWWPDVNWDSHFQEVTVDLTCSPIPAPKKTGVFHQASQMTNKLNKQCQMFGALREAWRDQCKDWLWTGTIQWTNSLCRTSQDWLNKVLVCTQVSLLISTSTKVDVTENALSKILTCPKNSFKVSGLPAHASTLSGPKEMLHGY